MGRSALTVLIADDQDLARIGLRTLVGSEEDLALAGEAADGLAAVDMASTLEPDVVLTEIRMPGIDGFEVTRRIVTDHRLTATRVVILTTFSRDEDVFEAVRAGASGFLTKDALPAEIIGGIRAAAAGGCPMSPWASRTVVDALADRPLPRPTPHPQMHTLTAREQEVLHLAAKGLTNHDIADRLRVSPATARTHISRSMTKLGARTRTELVVFAYQSCLA